MTRKSGLLLTTLALAFSMLFSACSAPATGMASPSEAPAVASSSAASYSESEYTDAMVAEENGFQYDSAVKSAAGEAPQQITAPANRKTIWRSTLSLESKEFDKAIAMITQQVAASGGYIESQTINGHSISYSGEFYPRTAMINARIPSDKLGEVTTAIGQTCNILTQSQSSDDVTDQYVDTQTRIEILKIQEERLLEILKKAGTLKDVFELEQELSSVRYEIESLTASLRHIDSQVAYSFLNMDLTEVGLLKEGTAPLVTFGDKMTAALSQTGDLFVRSFQGIALFCVGTLPILLFWILCIGLLVFAGLRISRRVQSKNVSKKVSKWTKPNDNMLKVGESAPSNPDGQMHKAGESDPTEPEEKE